MKSKNVASKQYVNLSKETGYPDVQDSVPWKSEQRFKDMLEVIPEMVFTVDKKGNFLFTNRSWGKYTGYSQEDVKAIRLFDLAHPDDLEALRERFIEVFKGDSLKDFEFKSKTKDGSYIDIQISLSSMLDSEGNVVAASGIGRDITGRQKAKQTLEQNKEYFQALIENAYDVILIMNVNGGVDYVSPSIKQSLGYEQEEYMGKKPFDLVHPDDLQDCIDHFARVIQTPHYFGYEELRIRHKDGSWRNIEAAANNLLDIPSVAGVVVNFHDITERKRSEETLQYNKERFQVLIENAYGVTTITNANGGIEYVSPSIKRYLGYEQEEFMGKNHFDLVHPDDLQACLDHFAEAIQTPDYFGYHDELRFQHKDGSWRNIEGTISNLLDYPSVGGIVVNFRDITERKQTEQKYKQLIEDMNDGYVVYQDERIVLANRRFADIYGYELEHVLGEDLFKFISPYSLRKIRKNYDRIMSGEKEVPGRDEVEGIKGDGTTITVDLSIKSIEYEGKPAFAIIFRDITEHKQAEEALHQSEQRFRTMFNNALDGICLADVETHQLFTGNKVFCEMLGYNIKDIAKMKTEDIHPEQDLSYVMKQFDRQAKGEITLARDIPMLRKDGSVFYTDVNSSPLTLNKRTYLMGIFRDITDKKLSEERLRAYQQQLQSLTSQLSRAEERERRRLAADLHDLIGQSLAVIKMKLNPWKNVLYSSGQASEMVKVLELLDSTISSTRSLTFDLSPPVVYELGIEAGLESLLEKFHELHSIQYEYKDDGKEKPLEDEICILLYRCTSELLMNVVKHAEAQLVRLSVSRENSQVSITLADDGVGFAVSETEGRGQGFGLLSIRERLNWVGGSFKLKSRPGGGTQATLKAPLKYTENSTKGIK